MKTCRILLLSLLIHAIVLAMHSSAASALSAGDTESATHADSAARYEPVATYPFKGGKVVQFNLGVLSHYSYIVLSQGKALIIDPGRDVQAYLDFIKGENAIVSGVWLSHSHADFVAGHMELRRATGSVIYQSDKSGAAYAIQPLKDEDFLTVGTTTLKFVETPGHTPDGMSAYLFEEEKPGEPVLVFTGDYLFVGSVGRPDLMEGSVSAAWLAGKSFDSWQRTLSKLPDHVIILPAHGAGSLCGVHLKDSPKSTIGEERRDNPYLRYSAKSEFIAAVLEGLPEAPAYFRHNARMNREGPPLVDWSNLVPPALAANQNLTDPEKYYVVDIRNPEEYASGHIPNSVNIGIRGRFENWVGTMVPWGADLVLAGGDEEVREAVKRLPRVGYSARVIPISSWESAGLPMLANRRITPPELHEQMRKGTAPIIVDVRLPSEWMEMRIGTVVNLPLAQLAALAGKLDPAEPAVVVCNSAYRSSLAVGILERRGFQQVSSLAGGMDTWIEAGLPVTGAAGQSMTANREAGEVRLPERISPSSLKQLVTNSTGAYQLVDIRPPARFDDYHLPGATNIDVADMLGNPAYLTGDAPLIVVDRDGSLAMMAAGALASKTARPIKVLHGGLEAYWIETEMKALLDSGAATRPSVFGPPREAPAAQDPSAAKPTEKPRKKRVGC